MVVPVVEIEFLGFTRTNLQGTGSVGSMNDAEKLKIVREEIKCAGWCGMGHFKSDVYLRLCTGRE